MLSPEEVLQFLSCVQSIEHRTILTICYAAGLRISEAISLRVTDIDSQRMVIRVEQEAFGQLDILVNNAGIYEIAPLGQITNEHFHRLFDLNVLGLILTTQEALDHFGPEGGSIINISSIVSASSPANQSVYNATKSAVDGLTRTSAKELGQRKIRVNSINPGPIETEGTHSTGFIDRFQTLIPILLARSLMPKRT